MEIDEKIELAIRESKPMLDSIDKIKSLCRTHYRAEAVREMMGEIKKLDCDKYPFITVHCPSGADVIRRDCMGCTLDKGVFFPCTLGRIETYNKAIDDIQAIAARMLAETEKEG